MASYTGVKVFSATKARERDSLGDVATDWIKKSKPVIKDTIVRQSSDREFHCLSIIIFYDQRN